jgi:YVTN family beta-propeller protein
MAATSAACLGLMALTAATALAAARPSSAAATGGPPGLIAPVAAPAAARETLHLAAPALQVPVHTAGQTPTVGSEPTGIAATDTTAYVANAGSDTVSVVDLTQDPAAVVATIPVGDRPAGVALSPDGSQLFVTNFFGGTLSIIDTATDTVTDTVTVGTDPNGVVEIGGSVYVANLVSGTISVVDPATGTVTGTITLTGTLAPAPSGLAASADGTYLYADDSRNGATDVIDITEPTPTVIGSASVGTYPAYLLTDGTTAYVANATQGSGPGTVSVLDVANPTAPSVTSTIDVGSHPYGVALIPATGQVLVANSGDGTVSVIDTASGAVVDTVPVASGPDDVVVTPDQTTAIVSDEGAGALSILHIDQPPVNAVPGAQEVTGNETPSTGDAIVFSVAGGDAISTSDPDAGTNTVQVSLGVSDGTLTLAQTTGLSFSAGANGSSSMTFSGTIGDIDADLDGLRYVPTPGFSGGDTLAFSVDDLGNSGDLGGPRTTTSDVPITVNGSPPVVGSVSFSGAIGNTAFGVDTVPAPPSTSTTGSVLSNSTDPQGGSLTVYTGRITTANGGSVLMNADGTFTYDPPAGFTGQDSFDFTVANGLSEAVGLATVTVADRVWYVDDNAVSDGSGTSTSPFNTLAGATGPGGPTSSGDDIFVFGGSTPYSGGITLKADQSLIGESAGLVVGGQTLLPASGANPVITNSAGAGITLGEGDTVSGITVSDTSGDGITADGIDAFTLTAGDQITGAGADGLDIDGGDGAIGDGASITGSGGHSLVVENRSGGTVTVSGSINDTGSGVDLASNTGATIDVGGGVTASTGANSAFTATGGGTVEVTGTANTLATTTGDALDVEDTTIAALGLNFESISAGSALGGPADGILLSSTGSTGPLVVTGTAGTSGSGGTIEGATDTGNYGGDVSLEGSGPVSLSDMVLDGAAKNGVAAQEIPNLTLIDNSVNGNGADGILYNIGGVGGTTDTTGGAFDLADNTLTDTSGSAIHLFFASGGLVTGHVTGNTITGSTGGEGIDIYSDGNGGTVTADVSANTISGIQQQFGILAAAQDGQAGETLAPTLNLTLTGNGVNLTSDAAQDGINVSSGANAAATVCLDATGNTSQSDGLAADSPTGIDAAGMSVYQGTDSSVFQIVGGPSANGGTGAEDTAVETYLNSVNTLTAGPGMTTPSQPSVALQFGSAGFTGALSCPTAPAPKLAAAAARTLALVTASRAAKSHTVHARARRARRRSHRLTARQRAAARRAAAAARRRAWRRRLHGQTGRRHRAPRDERG